ncbi:MAG TPA: ATP-dependent zinc metalloprotease FtsH [Polyangia bacterium]|jgi:cell division protease FtsH|nr:ATP-dependent zinc metalloprotease FtsH [Polyangia bacterium]
MESPEKKRSKFSIGYLILAFWGLLLAQQLLSTHASATDLAYTDFKSAISAGRVADVSIAPTVIHGHLKVQGAPARAPGSDNPAAPAPSASSPPSPQRAGSALGAAFDTVRVEDPGLLAELERQGVRVTGVADNSPWRDAMSWLLPVGLLLIFGGIFSRRLAQGGQNGFLTLGRNKAKVYVEKDVRVTFADAAGVDEAKEELREVIDFLKTPVKFARLGAQIPKGILLVGPPGTGKTLLARAVAGEAGVPFFSISGSDFVEMFVGVGAARVRDLFDQAKQKAPCIVFIDELDALGKVRGVGPVTHEEREQTLNQLLVELDGFDSRVGVILMAATNRPEILDPALLRAGRFDRQVLVDRPDKQARLAILTVHAAKVTLEAEPNLEVIAAMTAGFVGADLANIVNEAALLGVRRAKEKVGLAELQEAVERVIAGLEKKNRVLSAHEKKRVAYHELGHALIGMALPGVDAVQKISIIPRGIAALGYTLQVPTEDRFLMTESELKNKIAVLLGGRAAEELIYDEASTGAHDDLTRATDIARSMVKTFGMSPRLGLVTFERDRRTLLVNNPEPGNRGDYSEETAREIDMEVRRIIDEQIERVEELLLARRSVLMRAARVLTAKETITGDELRALLAAEEEEEADHDSENVAGGSLSQLGV